MSLKLSLNAEALERLLENDDEIRVLLTQGVSEEFQKRHKKVIIELVELEAKKSDNYIIKCIDEILVTQDKHGLTFNPSSAFKARAQEIAKQEIEKFIFTIITEQIATLDIKKIVEASLNSQVRIIVNNLVREKINKALID